VTWLRLTVPHLYPFERSLKLGPRGLQTAEAWDSLRTAEPSGSFGLGQSRGDWQSRALANSELQARALALVGLIRQWGTQSLVSLGVGTGMLEFLLKRNAPEIKLRCGDFAPATVELLRDRFPECDSIEVMDLAKPVWATTTKEVVLLHRVDTELADDAWKAVFRDLRARSCERIVLVPAGLLTPRTGAREARSIVAAVVRRQALRPSGWLRTPARMRQLFQDSYALSLVFPGGGLPIWALERRR